MQLSNLVNLGDDESSEDEPDELVPMNLVESKGKDNKQKKKPVIDEAKTKKAPISAAAKVKLSKI
jgi:hypothetical protein